MSIDRLNNIKIQLSRAKRIEGAIVIEEAFPYSVKNPNSNSISAEPKDRQQNHNCNKRNSLPLRV